MRARPAVGDTMAKAKGIVVKQRVMHWWWRLPAFLRDGTVNLYKALYHWVEDDGLLLAAATAYYAIFSLFPLLLLLVAILGLILHHSPSAQGAQNELLGILAQNTSDQVSDYVRQLLADIRAQAIVSAPAGVFALLFGAIGIFAQIDGAFHRIWSVPVAQRWGYFAPVRHALLIRLRSFVMLVVMGLLVIVAYVADAAAAGTKAYISANPLVSGLWQATHLGALFAAHVVILTILYRTLPKVKILWRHALAGAILAALTWAIARNLLTYLLARSMYTAYGFVGSVIIIMLWFYVASGLLYLGAEFVRVLGDNVAERSAMRNSSA